MRVIAGSLGGRRLKSAKGDWLRPTTDRTREFIFSYLGNRIEGTDVLDLFAGVGSLGIEAVSRGARAASFVDHSFQAITVLKSNLSALGIPAEVFKREAGSFLRETHQSFDIIFADPPYQYSNFAELLQIIRSRNLLVLSGVVVFETSSRNAPILSPGYRTFKEKLLGDTKIFFFEISDET